MGIYLKLLLPLKRAEKLPAKRLQVSVLVIVLKILLGINHEY